MSAISAAPGDADRESMPYGLLFVMATAVLVAITTESLPVGLLPEIGHDLHASDSQTGLLVSAYALVVAIGSVPMAALVARWPRRRVLGVLLLVFALSNVVMAGAPDYGVALLARLVGGVAHAGFFSAIFAAAIVVAPRERAGRAMAFVSGGIAMGLCFGVPLGTALGTAVGWRWAFLGCAIAMVLLAVLITVALPNHPAPASGSGTPVLKAIRRRPLLLIAATTVILILGHNTTYTYINPILLHDGVRIGRVSVVLAGYGLAGVIGLVLAGVIADRSPRRGMYAAIGLIAVCLLLLGLARQPATSVPVIVAWGVGYGSLPTLVQAVALRTVPDAPDSATSIINSAFNVGISGGAFLGARELLIVQPPALALTGCALVLLSLIPLAHPALSDRRTAPAASPQAAEARDVVQAPPRSG